MSTDTGSISQSKSSGIVCGRAYPEHEDRSRADRTAPVCLERRNKNESKLGKECLYNITDSDNRAKEVCH